jgi:3-oxoacyl-[acyl-carrier-protein] synthase II
LLPLFLKEKIIMEMRRVVITGMGIVSPLGTGIDKVWKNLIAGKSGIRKITQMDVSDITSQIGGNVPLPGMDAYDDYGFNPDTVMEPSAQRKVDPFIMFAMGAADEALKDANWHPETEDDRCRTGVLIGSGIGGLNSIYESSVT